MAQNKNKTDSIHDLLPKYLNSRTNTNWSALVDAIGSADQNTADLITEVKKQFFIKTAYRPYIDRLAANNQVSRPKFVGMDDESFRQYIPVLSYQPKQVKLIIDQLLDIFFFKESTTAFITSQNYEPFALQDGWELQYNVDGVNDELVFFHNSDFTDISNATANEIVAAINRQTKYSYATAEYDSITKNTYIRIFTNTIGSKGSLLIEGGRANVAFRLNGFIDDAGNGSNTSWAVTKIGDEVTFQYVGGASPGINQLQVGDLIIINMAGNIGSFPITNVDLVNQQITFVNLFGTVGTFTQSASSDVKFLRPSKYAAYLNAKRAMAWETTSGEITVEMPTSPPVVKRSLIGSAHMNGVFSQMTSRDSDTSMTLADATDFPNSGSFYLQEVNMIASHYLTISEDSVVNTYQNSSLIPTIREYTYSSRTALTTTGDIVSGQYQIINLASTSGLSIGQQVSMDGVPPYTRIVSIVGNIVNIDKAATITGNTVAVSFLGNQLTGISPSLPASGALNEISNASLSRSSNIVTVNTSAPHSFNVGDNVIINGCSGIPSKTTTGNTVANSTLVTNIASINTIAPGMIVTSAQFPTNTRVVGVSGNTLVTDKGAITTLSNAVLIFSEDVNGGHTIQSVSTNSFTYVKIGIGGTATSAGISAVENQGLAESGSKIILTSAVPNTTSRITGPYMWDPVAAPFVLSSDTGTTAQTIRAGKIVKLLSLNSNTIPTSGGYVVFDYGLSTQEGPVRYLYKPTDTTIAIDPSYIFKYDHSVDATITLINSNGPHQMSSFGTEYPAYITDPSQARLILEDLITSVKSSGIFVNFLVRYPEQLYGTLDVYNEQGLSQAGQPFS
jgi:hypothetical protein